MEKRMEHVRGVATTSLALSCGSGDMLSAAPNKSRRKRNERRHILSAVPAPACDIAVDAEATTPLHE
jgi:hypothetical protein